MITIGRLIYKATGVMSKKGIMKNCKAIGKTLADEIQTTGGKIEAKRVSELLEQTIGKKKASKITIAEDLDTFKAFAKENLNLTEEIAEEFYKSSLSAAIPPGRTGKSLLNLRLKNINPDIDLNIISHELEHLLYHNISLNAKISHAIIKAIPKKTYQNMLNRVSGLYNETMLDFQNELIKQSKLGSNAVYGITDQKAGLAGLLKQTGFESREALHDAIRTSIRQDILLPHCNSINLDLIKNIKKAIQDEARAYKVGGAVQHYFAPSETINKSEMLAQLYDEAAIVLKGEVKNQRNNIWRKLFHKPMKDYHIPKPILEKSSEEFEPFVKIEQSAIPKEIEKRVKTMTSKKKNIKNIKQNVDKNFPSFT